MPRRSGAAAISREEARAFQRRAAADPAWFMREVLGAHPYDRQLEMVESVRDHEQTSVVGANGVGKDWMVGRIVAWWQSSRYPAKTIITGPTNRQVADIVWREVRLAYYGARVPLGGRMLPSESKWEANDEHFALGFSTDRPFNITGFHSPNLLVVVTEAHGFSDANMTMIKRLLPNRIILTGNPFADSGEFFDSHHSKRHLYNAIKISAYDSPNLKAGAEVVPGIVSPADVDRMRADWGEDSPLFRATVLSEFTAREDGLIPLAWLMDARTRVLEVADTEPIVAGVDVAGPGEAETVAYVRQGARILALKAWAKQDPRGELVALLTPWKVRSLYVNVDSAGIGYYLARHLTDQGFKVRFVNVGEMPSSPKAKERYANLKAELYWGLRKRFEDGDVAGLVDETTIAQLSGIRYEHDSRGRIVIESKEQAAKRGVKSPDRAEALMLAFAYGPGVRLGDDEQEQRRPRDEKPVMAGLMKQEF